MSDVHAIIEVLDAVKVSVVELKEAMADGKIDVLDIVKLIPVVQAFIGCVKDFGDIPGEITGIDAAGVQAVMAKVGEIAVLIIGIFLKVQTKVAA